MKTKARELDVDYIGSQPSVLTKEEEKLISDYIRSHKTKLLYKRTKEKVNA
jgi:hypothetical protein